MTSNPPDPQGGSPKAEKATAAGLVPAADVARRFVARAEAAIADLEERFPAGISSVEQTLAEQIRASAARLFECAALLVGDAARCSSKPGA